MRLLKTLLLALFAAAALAAGVVAAAFVATVGVVVFVTRRLLLRPIAPRSPATPVRRPNPPAHGSEVIDVTATEVR